LLIDAIINLTPIKAQNSANNNNIAPNKRRSRHKSRYLGVNGAIPQSVTVTWPKPLYAAAL
jgi:hypothetical protein